MFTAKLDGENISLYRDDLHARSLDMRPRPSRTWVKSERGRIAHEIPKDWRLCGKLANELRPILLLLDELQNTPQDAQWHAEGNVEKH